MSFYQDLKKEIISKIDLNPICVLSGFAHATGEVGVFFGGSIDMTCDMIEVAEYISDLFCQRGLEPTMFVEEPHGILKKQMYHLEVKGRNAQILLDTLGLVDYKCGDFNGIIEGIEPSLITDHASMRSYLKGVFLAKGVVYTPSDDIEDMKRTGYHMEISLHSEVLANDLEKLLIALDCAPKRIVRRGVQVLYYKDSEKISDMMALLGANQSVFRINDIIVKRSMRNDVNRRTNCTCANISKTTSASAKQLDAIEYLDSTIGLKMLPKELRQMAQMRRENMEASLDELATIMNISKSGVNHRLRKIIETAEQIRNRRK